jgi:hypothetical protein
MKFKELKVGQHFKFDFESSGQWVYKKLDDVYFEEVQRPLNPIIDCGKKIFNIANMGDDEEVVLCGTS